MKIISAKDYQALSRAAANIISAQVILKPSCVLGLATGSSPVGTYQQLIEWYKKGDLDFSQVRTVNLDEYLGLSPHHEQSYRYFESLPVVITYTDGTTQDLTNAGGGIPPGDGETVCQKSRIFDELRPLDEVASVTVGDIVLPVSAG